MKTINRQTMALTLCIAAAALWMTSPQQLPHLLSRPEDPRRVAICLLCLIDYDMGCWYSS